MTVGNVPKGTDLQSGPDYPRPSVASTDMASEGLATMQAACPSQHSRRVKTMIKPEAVSAALVNASPSVWQLPNEFGSFLSSCLPG